MLYERLMSETCSLGVHVSEENIKGSIQGLYSDNVIWINKDLPTFTHKHCVLAEELGHHHMTIGDILNQKSANNRKQEQLARLWAYEKIVPLEKIIEGHHLFIRNKYEFADFLEVTEEFLEDALNRYKEKYGTFVDLGKYRITFEPLGVLEIFE